MSRVVDTPEGLFAACEEARQAGRRVGLVPTMGALHDGHMSLVEVARHEGADFLALTIFVNPKQFAPGEDLERYPRTLESDLQRCDELGVDVVFVPSRDAMYPVGFQTHVEVEALTTRLEGRHRPSHFRGVTTVVTKLLCATGACIAVFGRKDYQQWRILERMSRDLCLPVKVVGAPIAREPDGLALSSRNRYLNTEQRQRALAIVRALREAHAAHAEGERNASTLRALVETQVKAHFDRIDYVEVVDPIELGPPGEGQAQVTCLVAAHLGDTRLIDNLELGTDPCP